MFYESHALRKINRTLHKSSIIYLHLIVNFHIIFFEFLLHSIIFWKKETEKCKRSFYVLLIENRLYSVDIGCKSVNRYRLFF